MALIPEDRGILEEKIDMFTDNQVLKHFWDDFPSTKEHFYWYLKGLIFGSSLGFYNMTHEKNAEERIMADIEKLVDRRLREISDIITDLSEH